MKGPRQGIPCLIGAICLIILSLCTQQNRDEVCVVYTSVDQVYSEPILRAFEQESGIAIRAVYDVEATKTTGLVNRLIAEKSRPQADVFWSGEFAQTLLLKEKKVLSAYASPSASDIPNPYRDPEFFWTGFGGRARVLIVNTERISVAKSPRSLFDLLDARWPANEIAIANPLFGTTATHAAALYAALGPREARTFFAGIFSRGIRVVDGNAAVRDLVASGKLMMGLTDTDDACGAKQRGHPVELVFLDQGPDGLGTLLIPNTVALIEGARHEQEAKKVIDYLLSPETEVQLIQSGWSHISLRNLPVAESCLESGVIRGMDVSLDDVYIQFLTAKKDLRDIYIR